MTTNQAIYRALLGHSCVGKVGGGSYTIISLLMKAKLGAVGEERAVLQLDGAAARIVPAMTRCCL